MNNEIVLVTDLWIEEGFLKITVLTKDFKSFTIPTAERVTTFVTISNE